MQFNYLPFNDQPLSYPLPATIQLVVEDALGLYDLPAASRKYQDSVSESYTYADAVLEALYLKIVEAVEFSDSVFSSDAVITITHVEAVKFRDLTKSVWGTLINETLQFTETVDKTVQLYLSLRHIMNLTGAVDSAGSKLYTTIAEIIALDELIKGVDELTINETYELTMTADMKGRLRGRVAEIMELAETTSTSIAFMAVTSEFMNLSDLTASKAILYNAILENVEFLVSFVDGDEQYVGWVMNTKNQGVTNYTNYKFTDFHKVGGRNLAVGPSGLYELDGADDAGANIGITLSSGVYDLGQGKQSRLESMYLGAITDQKLVIKTLTGDGKERWYESDTPNSGLDSLRVKLGKGVKSRQWKWTLVTQQNADFYMDSIELLPVILHRRIK